MPVNLGTLQDAIGVFLRDDAGVTAALGNHAGRIQGGIAPDAQYPYVTIGEDEATDVSTGCVSAKFVTLPVHIWTSESGFRQSKNIEAAIVAALDDAALVVAGHKIIGCFHRASRFMRDPQQGVRHGMVEFEIDIEASA